MTPSKYAACVAVLGEPAEYIDETPSELPEFNGQVFAWWTPVFDRTLEDCVYGSQKGSLDAVFLNRVEANVDYLAFRIAALHRPKIVWTAKSAAWTRQLYLFATDFNRIQQNILNLRTAGPLATDTPTFVLSNANVGVSHETANAMEKILYDMRKVLNSINSRRRPLNGFVLSQNIGTQYVRR